MTSLPPPQRPVADIYEDCFLCWLGSVILVRERDQEGYANISDLNIDLLRQAFQAGWHWADYFRS